MADEVMIDDVGSVPSSLRHERFVATPLTRSTAELDFAAYMRSPEIIRAHSDDRWPLEDFSFSENLHLIAKHEDDHRKRRAFVFTLLNPRETESLGCLYLNPLREYLQRAGAPEPVINETPPDAAMVTFWVREDQQDAGLPEALVKAVHAWLLEEWPLTTHLFRILPVEESSRHALDQLGLKKVHLQLSGEAKRYIWYGEERS